MTYPLKAWLSHPGRNPEHDPHAGARIFVNRRNPSRWIPHQGAKEIARRAARAERGISPATNDGGAHEVDEHRYSVINAPEPSETAASAAAETA